MSSGLQRSRIQGSSSPLQASEPRLAIGRQGQLAATAANISLLEGEALAYKGQRIGQKLKKILTKLTHRRQTLLVTGADAQIPPYGGTFRWVNSEKLAPNM